jgi:very-short-patch-repair endonuclease
VFVEIDGKWHDLPASGPYDRHRQNLVVEILGWRPLRFDTSDILDRANYTARRLRQLIDRAESGIWDRPT